MDTFLFTTLKPGNKHMLCVVQSRALGHGLTFISEGLRGLCSSPCDGFTLHSLPNQAYLDWWPEFNLVRQVSRAQWLCSNAGECPGSTKTIYTPFFWKISTINKTKQSTKLHSKRVAFMTFILLLPLSLAGIKLKIPRNLRHF